MRRHLSLMRLAEMTSLPWIQKEKEDYSKSFSRFQESYQAWKDQNTTRKQREEAWSKKKETTGKNNLSFETKKIAVVIID